MVTKAGKRITDTDGNMSPNEEIKSLKLQNESLRGLLDNIIGELKNYELNGSDAVAQIRELYNDLENAFKEYRKMKEERDRVAKVLSLALNCSFETARDLPEKAYIGYNLEKSKK